MSKIHDLKLAYDVWIKKAGHPSALKLTQTNKKPNLMQHKPKLEALTVQK